MYLPHHSSDFNKNYTFAFVHRYIVHMIIKYSITADQNFILIFTRRYDNGHFQSKKQTMLLPSSHERYYPKHFVQIQAIFVTILFHSGVDSWANNMKSRSYKASKINTEYYRFHFTVCCYLRIQVLLIIAWVNKGIAVLILSLDYNVRHSLRLDCWNNKAKWSPSMPIYRTIWNRCIIHSSITQNILKLRIQFRFWIVPVSFVAWYSIRNGILLNIEYWSGSTKNQKNI